jgi:hypothetical protein
MAKKKKKAEKERKSEGVGILCLTFSMTMHETERSFLQFGLGLLRGVDERLQA